jgi:hypothetical protein
MISMGKSLNPNRTDVLEGPGAVQAVVTVGTSASEIKVGASRIPNRQALMVYNDGNATIFYSPSAGVTVSGATKGLPLYKDQFFILPVGDQPWYWICGSSNTSVIVAEVP